MSVEIIILERTAPPSDLAFRFALWATVPPTRVAALAVGIPSAWKGASPAQNEAIKAGHVAERVDQVAYPPGTPLATISADLISRHAAFQALINAADPDLFYGTTYDSQTGWTFVHGA